VLSRLGPYRDLGLSPQGRDHKKLQGDLADLIPPNLRYGLHVNLVQHGRTICQSERRRPGAWTFACSAGNIGSSFGFAR